MQILYNNLKLNYKQLVTTIYTYINEVSKKVLLLVKEKLFYSKVPTLNQIPS